MVRHKPGKEHIIPDMLSRLTNTNRAGYDDLYFELNVIFTYHTTLVEISPNLTIRIFDGYLSDDWRIKIRKQFLANKNLGPNKAILSFVFGLTKDSLSANPYFLPKPEAEDHVFDLSTSEPTQPMYDKNAQLIYHLNCVTGVCQLCIPPAMTPNLLAIAHGKSHPGFACSHEIISRSWYI